MQDEEAACFRTEGDAREDPALRARMQRGPAAATGPARPRESWVRAMRAVSSALECLQKVQNLVTVGAAALRAGSPPAPVAAGLEVIESELAAVSRRLLLARREAEDAFEALAPPISPAQ